MFQAISLNLKSTIRHNYYHKYINIQPVFTYSKKTPEQGVKFVKS